MESRKARGKGHRLAGSLLAAGLLAGLTALPAFAQMVADVKFEAGKSGAVVNGTVKGDEYFDYKLGARAGQKLSVALKVVDTNGDGTIYFNILPPGSSGEAIYNGSIDGNNQTTVDLLASGDYLVRVYLMGNDEDTGKTVGYSMDLSIK